jgi:3-dehydroquinate dehydratase type I
MRRPGICGVVVDGSSLESNDILNSVDLFELRIDLIGNDWEQLVPKLHKPWIACARLKSEGGNWTGNEAQRINELLKASEMGASIVDIEYQAEGLTPIVPLIKKRAKCLLSFHDFEKTPPFDELRKIVRQQTAAGADICKVVTTARSFEDNITMMELIKQFPKKNLIAFAMGTEGLSSRILCPLTGNSFTYAALEEGKESAPGQITVTQLRKIYHMLTGGR